jgi:hypothetical protein
MYGYGGVDCDECDSDATGTNACAFCNGNSYYTYTGRRQLTTYI